MKTLLPFLLIAICQWSFAQQTQYGVDLASSTPTTASSGFVFGWPQYANQNFLYNNRYINLYGFGFHGFDDGTYNINGVNAYVSSYFGIDFFTSGLRRLRVNANGNVRVEKELWADGGVMSSNDFSDTDPNYSWSSSMSVRNNNNAVNTFSRLSFISQSGGYGAIAVQKVGEYAGDMYLQVRNAAGSYHTPLLIKANGNIGIGTSTPGSFKLAVNGKIWGQEIQVAVNNPGPDYVFEKDYALPSLDTVQSYINQNKHLPEVPSAKEMEANGINLSEMNMLLLKKVEELTLYSIEMNRVLKKLSKENKEQDQLNMMQQKMIDELKNKIK